ncbi:MAG: tRNA (5-methylaminomethyl-2-thiouridine)(34)-methyltransferase MnmD [Bacteroidales bacterium]|nr:tRNA (5-methylaminomethyl-2-thiouridine)(34)-methyltransferase MnmD [Bacteroidales bacterium]
METNEIKRTADGSHTLSSGQFHETYHSSFGAIQESRHIFIGAGLHRIKEMKEPIEILEIGFGTGLNALLSFLWAEENSKVIDYTGIEAFPVAENLVDKLNYPELLSCNQRLFKLIHQRGIQSLSKYFQSQVIPVSFQDFVPEKNTCHLIFFDAFSPETQPEMWTNEGFLKLYAALKPTGILVTYSSKGIVKRALKEAGFSIEKIPGPPGKREFLRATK